jgi:hypothetical protein
MQTLQYRQEKIQAKRKQTPWREFLMEIASWRPLNLYRNKQVLSRYPESSRLVNIISNKEYN